MITLSLTLIILAFFLLVLIIYVKYLKPKKTKENFAFFAVSIIITLVFHYFSILKGKGFLIVLFENIYKQFINKEFTFPEPTNTDKVIGAIITTIIVLLIMYLYKNWPIQQQSTLEAERISLGKGRTGLMEGIKLNYQILKGDISINIYHKPNGENFEIFPPIQNLKLPFHIRIGQLIKLMDIQYDIDLGNYELRKNNKIWDKELDFGNDWYEKNKCYISKYGQNKENIAILCIENNDITQISEFKRFIETKQQSFSKIIITSEKSISIKKRVQNIARCNVEYYYLDELLNNLINFYNYEKYLTDIFFNQKLPNSNFSLVDIYTPLTASHYDSNNNRISSQDFISNVEKYVLNWVKDNKNENEHLAILGDYGQGKSVLSHKLSYEIIKNRNIYNRIPILIELRGISPRNMSIIDLLGHFGNQHAIHAQALYQLHLSGKLLIILEAYDEMDLVGDTEILMAHFQHLWQFASTPKSKIIITGRPNLFLESEKRRRALGINKKRSYLPYTKAIKLEPMSLNQIENVLRNTPKEISQQIISELHKVGLNSNFGELVRRPSTLFQLSIIWNNTFVENGAENINAASVIGRFIQNDYDRQESKNLNDGNKPIITSDERSFFMTGIAVGMMLKDGYSNQISNINIEEIIRLLYKNYPPFLTPYKDSAKGTLNVNLLERFKENKHDSSTVIHDVLASGILVEDLSGSNFFKFSHKSYLEYLVSAFFTNYLFESKKSVYETMITNAIVKTFGFKNMDLVYSSDVYNFIAQNVANKIEIRDKKGNNLDKLKHPEKYAKKIFTKFFPHIKYKFFPKIQSLNIGYPYLFRFNTLVLIIATLLYPINFYFNNYEPPLGFIIFIMGLIVLYIILFIKYSSRSHFNTLLSNNAYLYRLNLYRLTLEHMHLNKNVHFVSNIIIKILGFTDVRKVIAIEEIKALKVAFFIIIYSFLVFLAFVLYIVSNKSFVPINFISIISFLPFTTFSLFLPIASNLFARKKRSVHESTGKSDFLKFVLYRINYKPFSIFINIFSLGGISLLVCLIDTIYFLIDKPNITKDNYSLYVQTILIFLLCILTCIITKKIFISLKIKLADK